MVEIEFKPEEIISKITELQKVQIPRASEIALNQAVYAASRELKSQADNIFNNPVPFTVNSFLYKKAEQKGDKFVLNGSKLWITNGNEADLFIVFANIDHSKGYKGITAFIVEKSFTVT